MPLLQTRSHTLQTENSTQHQSTSNFRTGTELLAFTLHLET